ncbi:MAG: M56 family metallopeptidase [Planctomycetaceae bacterium]
MSAFLALEHPLAQRLAITLAHSLWQGALVAATLLVVVRLFDLRRPAQRYAATLVAFLMLAVSPLATFCIVAVPVDRAAAFEAAPLPRTALRRDMRTATIEIDRAFVESVGFSSSAPRAMNNVTLANARALFATLQPWLLLAWCGGVLILGARLLGGFLFLRRMTADAVDAPERLARLAARLGARLGLRRIPPLRLSPRAGDALAAGFFRPVVLLPISWATAMPADVLEAVLAHELAHIRRYDLWVNLAQRIVETLLFHHPAVWWLSRRLRRERELCCDETAVRLTGQPVGYARALEHVARWRVDSLGPVLATRMGGTKMALFDRVRHVLKRESGDRRSMWPAGLVALGIPLFALLIPAAFLSAAPDDEGAVVAQAKEKRDADRVKPERGDREQLAASKAERLSQLERDPASKERILRERGQLDPERLATLKAERLAELEKSRIAQADRPRPEGERRDGDRPRPEGERRDGDRLRPEGERRDGERDRPIRPEAERDRPQRPDGERERPFRPEGERPPRPEGERPFRPEGGPRGERPEMNPELIELVRQLRREVEELRREVRMLRGDGPRPPFGPEGGPRREGDRPDRPDFRPEGPRDGDRPPGRGPADAERREGDRPRPEGRPDRPDRPRPEARPDRPDAERREGDRPRADRPEGDRD